ncbi:hypothetical protein [Streptacidiphilus cavernicola]|uniref:Uncharacterized protein n=1 Tax=Streptacidiphilus cavernicola TaxID=3342716 RepID=A0ABV6VXU3_9ACTN
MPKIKPPEKKRARALQCETGRPYMSCLTEVRAQIAAEQAETETEAAPDFTSPTSSGLFSHA